MAAYNVMERVAITMVIILAAIGIVGVFSIGESAELEKTALTKPSAQFPEGLTYPHCTTDITDETDPDVDVFSSAWVTYCINGLEFVSVTTIDAKAGFQLGNGFTPTGNKCSCD